jgi:hypothetical protein
MVRCFPFIFRKKEQQQSQEQEEKQKLRENLKYISEKLKKSKE